MDTDTASHEGKVVVVEVSCEGRLKYKAAVMVIRLPDTLLEEAAMAGSYLDIGYSDRRYS